MVRSAGLNKAPREPKGRKSHFLLPIFIKPCKAEKKGAVAKMFCGEDTFLKKGSLPRSPSSKNF